MRASRISAPPRLPGLHNTRAHVGGRTTGCKGRQAVRRGPPLHYRRLVIKHLREGGLFDREELVAALRNSLSGEGTFTLLLGGNNVGKSQVMKVIAREYNQARNGIMAASTSQRILLYLTWSPHPISSNPFLHHSGGGSRRACHMPRPRCRHCEGTLLTRLPYTCKNSATQAKPNSRLTQNAFHKAHKDNRYKNKQGPNPPI
jgi:hypothetical protein